MNNSTDFAQCVKKAQKGDTEAFAELYSLVYKDLYRYALLNLNNNEHDASDAVSDAVLDAFASIGNLKNEQAFKTWMFRILTAKIKNKQKEYTDERTYRDSDELLAETESADETHFLNVELGEAMKSLDDDERLMLSLNAAGGYKSEEIAKITGSNANTVRSKIARAKEKLKKLLSEK